MHFCMVLLCILTLCKRHLQSNVDLHRGASETLFGKGKLIVVNNSRMIWVCV